MAFAQQVHVRDMPQVDMPAEVDSNSPAFWSGGEFHLYNSTGAGPKTSTGSDQFHLGQAQSIVMNYAQAWPTWMESVWMDEDGVVYGWYHREHFGVCPGTSLEEPQIGAAISYDGGHSFLDMGAILQSGDPIDCSSKNGYAVGGHGDFSVIVDRQKNYFYFLFSNYGGPLESQGVAIARMEFASRTSPVGNVWKYYQGGWTEPGIRGHMTPIFPATVSWQRADTDSFWGPSIHWNTYLGKYVMLLNRSCCSPGYPQEGIYVSYSKSLSNPGSWTQPVKFLDNTGWYPQVIGSGANGTDKLAGRVARLYIYGHSSWQVIFERDAPVPDTPADGTQPPAATSPDDPAPPTDTPAPDPSADDSTPPPDEGAASTDAPPASEMVPVTESRPAIRVPRRPLHSLPQ